MSDEFDDILNEAGEQQVSEHDEPNDVPNDVPNDIALSDMPSTEGELAQPDAVTVDSDETDVEYVDLLQLSMGGRDFLLLAGDVTEIVRPIPLTPVPMAPDHLLGMGNVHGQIVCVIEPGKQLSLPEPPKADDDATRFVVLRHKRMRVALRVDAVSAIHRLDARELENMQEANLSELRGRLNVEGITYDVLHAGALLQE